MNRSLIHLVTVAAAAGSLAAQGSNYSGPANLVFGMDNTVEVNSLNNTNQAHIVSDDGLMTYAPMGPRPFALPLVDGSTWAAFFGDEDNDGDHGETIIGSLDAVHVPRNAPCPPSMFDVWVSVQTGTDAGGYLGAAVTDGDIFRLTPSGVEIFISQAQITAAGVAPSTSNVDVDGFAIDESNGDLYFTFTATTIVSGTSAVDDAVIRIPGGSYTTTGGLVTSVTANSAEVVMTKAEVDTILTNAGFGAASDLNGIELDPNGGTFVSTSTSKTVAHLWLTDDSSSKDAIISTVSGGVIPSVNGVAMQGAAAFGLRGGLGGGALGNPWSLAFQQQSPGNLTPMHADVFPFAQTTPTTFDFDCSGATPNGFTVYIFGFSDAGTAGAFAPRGPAPIPVSSPSWLEYYPGFPAPAALVVAADAEGFTTLPLSFPALPPGIGFVCQVGDIGNLVLSSPVIAVTE
ncbi:MAG: hypothetical protein NXI31_16055 [bacterium]|nr:hypothetical protein [bacterium]